MNKLTSDTNASTMRMYLDLDGVVYPIAPLDEVDVDRTDVAMLHEREWWRNSVVRRLGAMGLDVVMASSWGGSFMDGTIASPRKALAPHRALAVHDYPSKAEAVIDDLSRDPVPFVWIDDDMTPATVQAVKRATDAPGVFVKPYSRTGLTGNELDAIEDTVRLRMK